MDRGLAVNGEPIAQSHALLLWEKRRVSPR
jgi:hypothetical protein